MIRYFSLKYLKNNNKLTEFSLTLNRNLIKTNYIFFDSRGEVSLQRRKYISEKDCASIGKTVYNDLIGIITFKKEEFEKTVENYRQEDGRDAFNANLLWSPLDINNNLRLDRPIFTTDPGLPAHSGINYIEPAAIINENPNTAIRMFSHFMMRNCELELLN